ncbi:DUF1302 family protein [Zavarzinia aquatilis]|uniref:DUF1302 domain-containing protein n=1 Tax=Zavarzinia aquatilis TaxID=2211142 RepID=A0A317EDY2_9PROT|nr:DUF1302 family protein [Zavarzinia aquatilis]PWR25248.1 hypothetical protein DKG74_05660 [Zavarzinia aquatilis]
MKRSEKRLIAGLMGSCALVGLVMPAFGVDFSISGFVQQQIAVKITDQENPNNQAGDPFNGKKVPLEPLGADLGSLQAVNNLLSSLSLPQLNDLTNPLLGSSVTVPPTGYRDVRSTSNDFNLMMTRIEVNMQAAIDANWSASATVRAVYDWNPYKDVSGNNNFYETQFHSGGGGTPLEYAEKDFMVDLPNATINYTNGSFYAKLGNQQIAWGEAVFFRVMDVPNGLDLRRHLILDPGLEEYSDKRVPGLGLRMSYQLTPDWEVEGFIQKFEPSIFPTPSSPYNLIPDQFTLHERYRGYADDLWNVGGRIRAQLGDLGLQFIAVSRHNPDGAIRWTKSGVDKDIPILPGSGKTLAETPFEVDQERGVKSQEEWFYYAGAVRLDGVQALNSAVDDFQPSTGALTAYNVGEDPALARAELDTFFWLSGGLRGHIERIFPYENVFGASANYVFSGSPGSFMEQLIGRVELTYTPNKVYTAPSLGKDFLVEDEWAFAAVAEKWYRWSEDFPAAYLVAQYIYKSASDLFSRNLQGYGGDENGLHGGISNYQAVAFAGFQPSPSLEWRFEWAVLYDLRGGWYIQPGVRWKPDDKWQVDLHATVIAGKDDNKNAVSSIDFADEISLRVTYQF